MHRIFISLRNWLSAFLAQPCGPDPLDEMSLREFADLPPTHPAEPEPC
jgi:hypothetical protein